MRGWQANSPAYLCQPVMIRAMPENEILRAMHVDNYLLKKRRYCKKSNFCAIRTNVIVLQYLYIGHKIEINFHNMIHMWSVCRLLSYLRGGGGGVIFAVLVRGLAEKVLKGAVKVARVLVAHGADDLLDGQAAGAKQFLGSPQAVLLQ